MRMVFKTTGWSEPYVPDGVLDENDEGKKWVRHVAVNVERRHILRKHEDVRLVRLLQVGLHPLSVKQKTVVYRRSEQSRSVGREWESTLKDAFRGTVASQPLPHADLVWQDECVSIVEAYFRPPVHDLGPLPAPLPLPAAAPTPR